MVNASGRGGPVAKRDSEKGEARARARLCVLYSTSQIGSVQIIDTILITTAARVQSLPLLAVNT